MVGSGFVISTHNTEIDKAMSTWSCLARCGSSSLCRRLSDYVDLVLFYLTSTSIIILVTLINKKLRYREEHSASVVLSWCTL